LDSSSTHVSLVAGDRRLQRLSRLDPRRYLYRYAYVRRKRDRVKGYFRIVFQSSAAPYVVRWVGFAIFALAALPDFLGVSGWRRIVLYAILLMLWVALESFKEFLSGHELDNYRNVFRWTADLISDLSGRTRLGAPRNPDLAITALLRRVAQLARETMKAPHGTEFSAHLLRPVLCPGCRGLQGLQAIYHDDARPGRRHELIPLDAPGAPLTFEKGAAAYIPDTNLAGHPRVKDKPYQSVGTFPIWVGPPGAGGKVFAVLSIDATCANVFTAASVKDLAPFVAPIAQLIGLALTLDGRPR